MGLLLSPPSVSLTAAHFRNFLRTFVQPNICVFVEVESYSGLCIVERLRTGPDLGHILSENCTKEGDRLEDLL